MQTKEKIKFDSRLIGIISGFLLPIITMVIMYLYRNQGSFEEFYNQIESAKILSRMVSLCVIPNLLLFFIFMRSNRLQSAYGVIGATLLYAIVILTLTTFV